MSPPARTSASSSRNSVGVSASDRSPDASLVTAGLQDEVSGDRAARPPSSRHRVDAVDPPHDRADPRQQLGLAERLRQVVVRPEAERPDLGGLAALARHDEDRCLADGPHLAGDVEPVRARHREVEQDEVGMLLAEALDGGQPVVGGDDLVALGADEGGDGPHHRRVVIDDEDAKGAGGHRDHVPLACG